MTSTPEAIRTQILDLVGQYHQAKFAHKTFDPDKDLVHYAGRVFDAEEIVKSLPSPAVSPRRSIPFWGVAVFANVPH